MPTIAAKNALATIWRLVFASGNQPLTDQDLAELRRACDVLLQQIPGKERYNDEAEQLCLGIHSSAIFETGNARHPDRLLDHIDQLREFLE